MFAWGYIKYLSHMHIFPWPEAEDFKTAPPHNFWGMQEMTQKLHVFLAIQQITQSWQNKTYKMRVIFSPYYLVTSYKVERRKEEKVASQLTVLFHRVESFQRSQQLLWHSKNAQLFIKPKGSLLCSQKHFLGLCPKTNESSLHTSYLFFINS
jgi:hypothetical protein